MQVGINLGKILGIIVAPKFLLNLPDLQLLGRPCLGSDKMWQGEDEQQQSERSQGVTIIQD
jgi:hypothetical protein